MLIESARSNWIKEYYRDIIIKQQQMAAPCEPWIKNGVTNWSKASKEAKDCEDEVVLTPDEEKNKLERNMDQVWCGEVQD